MLIYTVHMLLYRTNARRCIGLWSLQVCIQFARCVSVANVRARDFKRVFFMQTNMRRVFLTLPQEGVVAVAGICCPVYNQSPLGALAPQSKNE